MKRLVSGVFSVVIDSGFQGHGSGVILFGFEIGEWLGGKAPLVPRKLYWPRHLNIEGPQFLAGLRL